MVCQPVLGSLYRNQYSVPPPHCPPAVSWIGPEPETYGEGALVVSVGVLHVLTANATAVVLSPTRPPMPAALRTLTSTRYAPPAASELVAVVLVDPRAC